MMAGGTGSATTVSQARRADVTVHEEFGGFTVELFGDVFADFYQIAAASVCQYSSNRLNCGCGSASLLAPKRMRRKMCQFQLQCLILRFQQFELVLCLRK